MTWILPNKALLLPARTREVKSDVNTEVKSDVNNPLSRRRSCLFDFVDVSLYLLSPSHTGSVCRVFIIFNIIKVTEST